MCSRVNYTRVVENDTTKKRNKKVCTITGIILFYFTKHYANNGITYAASCGILRTDNAKLNDSNKQATK